MTGVVLKGLAGRKIRALLTAFAVVIGVSMVSGTFVLTDTMQKSFDDLFSTSYAGTDAVIEGRQVIKNAPSDVRVPESVLAQVRALPEVQAAGGAVMPEEPNTADIIGEDGKKVANEGSGTSFDPDHPQFSFFQLKTGAWAQGPREVVIDAGTAAKQGYAPGDTITISTRGTRRDYTLTGTITFGGVDSLGFASIAAWDLETAQKLYEREGAFDSISISARNGVSRTELVEAVRPLLPGTLTVQDSAVQAEAEAGEVDEGMAYIRYFLLGFGGIALLVGAFVIFNTLSITVAQRTREFATLRTLGASRRQIMRSVVAEGLVLGLVASVIGLVLGLGIARGMVALFSALGVDLPDGSTVFAARTVIVSLVLGTAITLVASILPARRATRIPPIAAVREGSSLPPGRIGARSLPLGAGVVAAAIAAVSIGIFAEGLSGTAVGALLAGGILLLFLGIALVAPHLVTPLARIVGWPARRAGVAGELAGANAVRNPTRTASTAAALMIGLTLVTVVAVLGAGLRSSTETAVSEQLSADFVASGKWGMPFRAAEGRQLAAVPGVTAVSHVRGGQALVDGEELQITGIDPATIERFYAFEWTAGSLRALGADGAIVSQGYADDRKLAVGDPLPVQTASGERRTLTVRGIHDPPQARPLLGDVTMSQEGFDQAFADPRNTFTFLDAPAGTGPALEAAAADFGDAEFATGSAYAVAAGKELDTFLALLYVLLGFSVVVSLFGMVNTLVLSVFERTRELGMLRAVGMTRRQARRMIRHESIITALIGAALGLSLGIFLAVLVTQALAQYDVGFTLPVTELAAFTVVALVAGVLASVVPARRASRLDVLHALQYE